MAARSGRTSFALALLTAAGVGAAQPAFATDQGFYGLVGAGIGYWNSGTDSRNVALGNSGGGTGSTDQTSGAFKIGLGYQLNVYNGIDLAYHDSGRFSHDLQTTGLGNVKFDIKVRRLALSYVLNIPATKNLSFTGRVGVNRWEENRDIELVDLGLSGSEKRNDTDTVLGLGMRYRIGQQATLAVEYEHFHQQEDDLYQDFSETTVGLLFRF